MGEIITDSNLVNYKDCGKPLIIKLTDAIREVADPKGNVKDIQIAQEADYLGAASYKKSVYMNNVLTEHPIAYSFVLTHELTHINTSFRGENLLYDKAPVSVAVAATLANFDLPIPAITSLVYAATSYLYTKLCEFRCDIKAQHLTGYDQTCTFGVKADIKSNKTLDFLSNLTTGNPFKFETKLAMKLFAKEKTGDNFVDKIIKEHYLEESQAKSMKK